MLFFPLSHFVLFFISAGLATQSCYKFCKYDLATGYLDYDELVKNAKSCSHLILDSYDGIHYKDYLLERALTKLQSSDIPTNLKILASVLIDLPCNETNETMIFKTFKKFDGFYVPWFDEDYFGVYGLHTKQLKIKRNVIKTYLSNLRNNFGSKLIVVNVGADFTIEEYFDFVFFNKTVDFVALKTPNFTSFTHEPNNWLSRKMNDASWSSHSRNKTTLDYLASTWMDNGFPQEKMLILNDGPDFIVEARLKAIWSSLNNFAGILIDNVHKSKFEFPNLNEMVECVQKFEKILTCFQDKTKNQQLDLICYFSLTENIEIFTNKTSYYQKCHKVIFQMAEINSNYNIAAPIKNLHTFIKHIRSSDMDYKPLFFSFRLNANINDFDKLEVNDTLNKIALNIYNFIKENDLDGIEIICDSALRPKIIEEIITSISSKCPNIHIGLQVDSFEASKLIPIINKVTWVTHKINPLSDSALEIYYQWNKLHENYGLNLTKVIVKIAPGIWQQNSSLSFLNIPKTMKDEMPETDIILNRKYLCLNETIKQNLPVSDRFSNLPVIFTIKGKRNISETPNIWSMLNLFKKTSSSKREAVVDLYHIRYDNAKIIDYKVKVAVKHGFGGIAISSINDDDFDGICGKPLFEDLTKIISNNNL